MTLAQLRSLSERELHIWMRFAGQKGFHARRQEIQLARIALTVAQCAGNQDMTLNDFLLDKVPDKKMNADDGANAIAMFGGVGVRKLGQGRKRK